jgi:hypothetical protein
MLPPSSEAILMMEAERTSETLVNFYQTTRRYNPEDSRLRTHRRENLKSYLPRNLGFSLLQVFSAKLSFVAGIVISISG